MIFRFLLLIALVCGGLPVLAPAAEQSPLLMPGKKTLYQRVLSKPEAMLYAAPGQSQGRPITPFTAYYVYARQTKGDQVWVQVGTDSHGQLAGWIVEAASIPWNQSLTVSFRDPRGHDRVLLFKDKASLKQMIEATDQAAYKQLYAAALAGQVGDHSPVVAMQPDTYIDILQDFYLIPILDHEDIYLGSELATMLQVTTAPLDAATAVAKEPAAEAAPPASAAMPEGFRSGLVFVVDATLSMGPYIERTRQVMQGIIDQLKRAGVDKQMRYGLVAFRDSTEAVPGLQYRAKVFADLQADPDGAAFLNKLRAVEPAQVSSQDFIEDAYAGVQAAIDKMQWDGLNARYIVLITDAGARGKDDPLSATHLDAKALNQLAQNRDIAIAVLHLLTPNGTANHASAQAQYTTLANYPGIGSLYYGVPAGDVAKFGRAVDALASQISGAMRAQAPLTPPTTAATQPDQQAATLEQLQARVAKLGYALRMKYLKQEKGQQIPALFNAWMVDRDFRNPEQRTLDVRVLLTRDQLSDLHEMIGQILETFEEGLLSPKGFLDNIRRLAATVSRDPSKLSDSNLSTLSEMGFMREYIEDLPYRSEAMDLTLEDWSEWPAARQIDYIHRLEDKLRYYQSLYDHPDLWVSLDGGPVNGSSVFPVELEMLP